MLFAVKSELEPVPCAAKPLGGQWLTLENALCVQPAVSPKRWCWFWVWNVVVILSDSDIIWRAPCPQGLECPGAALWTQPFRQFCLQCTQTGGTFCVCYRLSLFHRLKTVQKWLADFPLPLGISLKNCMMCDQLEILNQGDWKVLTHLHGGRRHFKLSDGLPAYNPCFRQWSKIPIRAGIQCHEIQHQGLYN